jgi:hypothetical protein
MGNKCGSKFELKSSWIKIKKQNCIKESVKPRLVEFQPTIHPTPLQPPKSTKHSSNILISRRLRANLPTILEDSDEDSKADDEDKKQSNVGCELVTVNFEVTDDMESKESIECNTILAGEIQLIKVPMHFDMRPRSLLSTATIGVHQNDDPFKAGVVNEEGNNTIRLEQPERMNESTMNHVFQQLSSSTQAPMHYLGGEGKMVLQSTEDLWALLQHTHRALSLSNIAIMTQK